LTLVALSNIIVTLSLIGAAAAACPEQLPGSAAADPLSLASANGELHADFIFRTSVDGYGIRHYCYMYGGSVQAPTLRVHPGDQLVLRLRNELPSSGDLAAPGEPPFPHAHTMEIAGPCGGGRLFASSTNLHFHGLHIAPACHQDDVISTLVEPSGGWYEYRFQIPQDQPPGLYWYHPHPHGFSEAQVLGGASGALIVEGMERANPKVAGLGERVLILRDQLAPGLTEAVEDAGPGKDISLNFVPVLYPLYRPAVVQARSGQREFWRVLNAAADTYFDLQLSAGPGIRAIASPLNLELVALDGVPSASAIRNHVLIPPGGRAEFLVTMPPQNQFAQLVALKYDTGPEGESTPYRIVANLDVSDHGPLAPSVMPGVPRELVAPPPVGLAGIRPARRRKLYFSEAPDRSVYYITLDGHTPKPFDMSFKKPAITAKQGTVEDWVIENRATEAHAFHIHQLHFQLLARDGAAADDPSLRDTIDLPFWDGKSPYPSVTLRMDFRSPATIGTFLYHCHILEHEDAGMMGLIRVTSGAANPGCSRLSGGFFGPCPSPQVPK
jgi:FtsP/CotA-like multicopper oxidase with cupredoxin domain